MSFLSSYFDGGFLLFLCLPAWRADVARVASHVKAILQELKRDQGEVSLEYIRLFCRNSNHVRVLKYISLEEEYKCFSQSRSSYLQSLLYSENTAENAFVYVRFLLCPSSSLSLSHSL